MSERERKDKQIYPMRFKQNSSRMNTPHTATRLSIPNMKYRQSIDLGKKNARIKCSD